MRLAALLLVAVVPGSVSALWRGLDRPALEEGGQRLGTYGPDEPQTSAQIISDRFESTGLDPALGLLVDRFRRRKSCSNMRQSTCPDHPAQGIEDFTELMLALQRFLGHRREIRATKAQSASVTSGEQGGRCTCDYSSLGFRDPSRSSA